MMCFNVSFGPKCSQISIIVGVSLRFFMLDSKISSLDEILTASHTMGWIPNGINTTTSERKSGELNKKMSEEVVEWAPMTGQYLNLMLMFLSVILWTETGKALLLDFNKVHMPWLDTMLDTSSSHQVQWDRNQTEISSSIVTFVRSSSSVMPHFY